MSQPLRRFHLALEPLHDDHGAGFEDSAGWHVPSEYTGFEAEHRALRTAAGLFDRSDRSRFIVSGTDAVEVLSAAFAGHVRELEEGRAMRSVALDGHGEIRDLVLIARTGGIAYLVVGEPGQRVETRERLESAIASDFDARVDDRTESTCLLSIAGPAAAASVREHLADALPARLQTLHCVTFEFHGFRALAMRTSGVGEDGFDFMLAPAVAQHVLETLTAAGLPLVGRRAEDAARVESCIPAFVPDLETGLSPAEADLDVMLDVPGGRERWMLSALLFDRDASIPAGTVLVHAGRRAGEVRSSAWSPLVSGTVVLAVVEAGLALPGTDLDAGGRRGTIVAKPFYRRRS